MDNLIIGTSCENIHNATTAWKSLIIVGRYVHNYLSDCRKFENNRLQLQESFRKSQGSDFMGHRVDVDIHCRNANNHRAVPFNAILVSHSARATRRRVPCSWRQICSNSLVIIALQKNKMLLKSPVLKIISHVCACSHCFRDIQISFCLP